MNKTTKLLISVVVTGILASCGTPKQDNDQASNDSILSIDIAAIDSSIRPQDDFFLFANGIWLQNTVIPASESRWGSFDELDKANNQKLTAILQAAAASKAEKGSAEQLVGDYYSSFMDKKVRNEISLPFLTERINRIMGVKSKDEMVDYIASIYPYGISTFFGFGVGQDLLDVDNHTVYISQDGLGLPNRNYYFDETKAEIREKYVEFIARCLELAGIENAATKSRGIFEFEQQLAEKMMKPDELRDPEAQYNKFSRSQLITAIKPFNFESFLNQIGIETFDTVIVGQPEYIRHAGKLFDTKDLNTLKDFQLWKLINHYAGHLSDDFVQANFEFYRGVLSGAKEMKPMDEQVIEEITDQPISESLGKLFVDKHFSPEAKNKINRMVDDLLDVYRERIEQLDWMTDETKKQALIKLEAIGRKLGYPDAWKDLSMIDIRKDNYLHNIDQCALYESKDNLSRLNKPVDKDEWGMPPHMVNAYYHPLLNEIAFPAGIMQYPFFDVNAEDAVNYGGIGMVIGHEFTHGFDDMGSKFAADGSFTNWWTPIDRERFEERTAKLGATFSNFCPIHEHCVNPDLTMGENIADLGGITMAYYAYTRTDEFKRGEVIHGFTPAQRFFVAYAQLWKIKYTDEELKKRIATDPHSPGMYRVNGPLMNCPEFFEAFGVKEGDPMRNPVDRISKIW
jgi:putative endopeptidase